MRGDRSEAIDKIRAYFNEEWRIKMVDAGLSKIKFRFNTTAMPTVVPSVPQQRNTWDCGVYMLTFVERIFDR